MTDFPCGKSTTVAVSTPEQDNSMTPDEMIVHAVARLLMQARQDRGMTQSLLAQLLGIAPSYINVIEKGKRCIPSGDWIVRWGVALGMSDLEIDTHCDLANAGRAAWNRLTKELKKLAQERDHQAAFDTIEALLSGVANINVVLERAGPACPTGSKRRPRLGREERAPSSRARPTVILHATYVATKGGAM